MMFSQSYPIIAYALILTILTLISFFIALRKKKMKKVLLILPKSFQKEIRASITNGISRNIEIFSDSGKVPLRIYKSCVFVLDPKENLEKQIENFKKVKEFAEDSIAILISESLDGVSSLKERIPDLKIFRPSEVEKVREIINMQTRRI